MKMNSSSLSGKKKKKKGYFRIWSTNSKINAKQKPLKTSILKVLYYTSTHIFIWGTLKAYITFYWRLLKGVNGVIISMHKM